MSDNKKKKDKQEVERTGDEAKLEEDFEAIDTEFEQKYGKQDDLVDSTPSTTSTTSTPTTTSTTSTTSTPSTTSTTSTKKK